MQVFSPIAHRLGIKTIKDELEDRSLLYLDPIGYKEIEDDLLMTEEGRDKFIESIKNQILAKTEGTIPCSYLNFKRNCVFVEYSCMERLVHIRLRH